MSEGKITLNAMHVDELQKLLENDEVIKKCARCNNIIETDDEIGALTKQDDKIVAICKFPSCMKWAFSKAMTGPEEDE